MSHTPHDLAQILNVPLPELERMCAGPSSMRYRYERRLIGKKVRLLRIPLPRHRRIVDRIKSAILDPMPLPDTMYGWRKKRSTKGYIKHHLRRSVIINVDIQDFFPSVNGARVHAFWLQAGFDHEAAKLLTALTVCDNQLPQGSPTSQSIGNHVLIRLDRRLNRLAELNGAEFSSYGDEFSLSGRKRVRRLKPLVMRIVEQEGFGVSPEKVKDLSHSQKQELAGIITNKKPSLGRDDYRRLRAIIHNCQRYGANSQNRGGIPYFKDQLRGRISYLQQINPILGARMLCEFYKIPWE